MPDFKNKTPTFVGALFFHRNLLSEWEDEQGILKNSGCPLFLPCEMSLPEQVAAGGDRGGSISLLPPRRQVAGFQKIKEQLFNCSFIFYTVAHIV